MSLIFPSSTLSLPSFYLTRKVFTFSWWKSYVFALLFTMFYPVRWCYNFASAPRGKITKYAWHLHPAGTLKYRRKRCYSLLRKCLVHNHICVLILKNVISRSKDRFFFKYLHGLKTVWVRCIIYGYANVPTEAKHWPTRYISNFNKNSNT